MSTYLSDILRERRQVTEGQDKELWGRRLRIPFELRDRWPNSKKVMDIVTELAAGNNLRVSNLRLIQSWPRQYVVVTMASEAAAKRMANIILQEGSRYAFVAEYISAAEEARNAARERGAGAGAGGGAGASGRDVGQGRSGQRQGADTWATGSQGRGRGGWGRIDEGLLGRGYRGSQEGRQQFEGRGGGGGRVHGSPVRLGGTVEDSRTGPTPGRHALPPGRGEQQPAWSPEESVVTRAQHRATMDKLTATFNSSLRNLSTAVEERLASVDGTSGGCNWWRDR